MYNKVTISKITLIGIKILLLNDSKVNSFTNPFNSFYFYAVKNN